MEKITIKPEGEGAVTTESAVTETAATEPATASPKRSRVPRSRKSPVRTESERTVTTVREGGRRSIAPLVLTAFLLTAGLAGGAWYLTQRGEPQPALAQEQDLTSPRAAPVGTEGQPLGEPLGAPPLEGEGGFGGDVSETRALEDGALVLVRREVLPSGEAIVSTARWPLDSVSDEETQAFMAGGALPASVPITDIGNTGLPTEAVQVLAPEGTAVEAPLDPTLASGDGQAEMNLPLDPPAASIRNPFVAPNQASGSAAPRANAGAGGGSPIPSAMTGTPVFTPAPPPPATVFTPAPTAGPTVARLGTPAPAPQVAPPTVVLPPPAPVRPAARQAAQVQARQTAQLQAQQAQLRAAQQQQVEAQARQQAAVRAAQQQAQQAAEAARQATQVQAQQTAQLQAQLRAAQAAPLPPALTAPPRALTPVPGVDPRTVAAAHEAARQQEFQRQQAMLAQAAPQTQALQPPPTLSPVQLQAVTAPPTVTALPPQGGVQVQAQPQQPAAGQPLQPQASAPPAPARPLNAAERFVADNRLEYAGLVSRETAAQAPVVILRTPAGPHNARVGEEIAGTDAVIRSATEREIVLAVDGAETTLRLR